MIACETGGRFLRCIEWKSKFTCLLVGIPETVQDLFRQRATPNSSRSTIFGYSHVVELVHPNFDAGLHLTNRTDGAMFARNGKKRQVELIGELDLGMVN